MRSRDKDLKIDRYISLHTGAIAQLSTDVITCFSDFFLPKFRGRVEISDDVLSMESMFACYGSSPKNRTSDSTAGRKAFACQPE